VGALVLGVALAAVVLLGSGGGGHTYHLLFSDGAGLVNGNEVLVAGQPIGTVDGVSLTDDAQAEVTITVDRALHNGTTAAIHATSLSGIANKYVSIDQGPDSSPALADGATLTGAKTTTPVELDQLFDTFRPRLRHGLQKFIQGFNATYAGSGPEANRTYKFLAPGLTSSQRLFDELTHDQRAFTGFLVNAGKVLTGVAERRDDLSALTQNANETLGAIARENESLDRTLVALPPAMRQGNTTFVNLRAALDDLTPLVRVSLPATKDLAPFLRELRPVARRAVPVFSDLRQAIALPGSNNDLTDALVSVVPTEKAARKATPGVVSGLSDSQPVIKFIRPYSPDLFAAFTKLGEVTGYYDADGHYARVQPAGANLFAYNQGTQLLEPISPTQQLSAYSTFPGGTGPFTPCPGGATQAISGSNPFLDDGNLNGDCNSSDVPPGP
jgi:phospholipid/cholesterol/gamma-HCH transport system substrate-binding protein